MFKNSGQKKSIQSAPSRRQFFKTSTQVVGGLLATPMLVNFLASLKAKAADVIKYVVPGQGMAASINYVENKKLVKKELQQEKQAVKFADQFCSNCQLFTAKDKKDLFGKCALFPSEHVKVKAWCSSWAKKA